MFLKRGDITSLKMFVRRILRSRRFSGQILLTSMNTKIYSFSQAGKVLEFWFQTTTLQKKFYPFLKPILKQIKSEKKMTWKKYVSKEDSWVIGHLRCKFFCKHFVVKLFTFTHKMRHPKQYQTFCKNTHRYWRHIRKRVQGSYKNSLKEVLLQNEK